MAKSVEKENERLRAELAEYKQRELAGLRSALAEARGQIEHYRSEAHRNAALVREVDASHREAIERLRNELASVRAMPNYLRVGAANGN